MLTHLPSSVGNYVDEGSVCSAATASLQYG